MIDRMFTNSKLLEHALDASLLKNEVISNNIANVDTPGFKKKVVRFEELLRNAMDINGNATTSAQDIVAQVDTDMANLSYRTDGNNVDIDTEMAEMAKNTIRYNLLITRMNGQFNQIKTVLKGG